METNDIKSLLDQQGKAFEAFKDTVDGLKKSDSLTEEKLARIEASLDAAVEGKAAIEAKLAAEAKEREELEIRLSRRGSSAGDDKAAAEVKSFGAMVGSPVEAKDYDAYKAGMSIYLRKGEKLLDNVQAKAMSVGGDPDGGYLVPVDMSGRIVTKVFETSPIRQIANVQAISSDKLEGLEDRDEASAGWVGETGSRTTTATPQVGKYSIEAFELYAQPAATQKLLDDAAVDIEAWLAAKIADKISRIENAAYVNGTGAMQPRGFASYTTAADSGSGVTWGSIGHVVSGAAGGFAAANPADKLHDLIGLVKDAYLTNARFVTRRSVITAVRKFKDGMGNYLWQPSFVLGQPETIMGYAVTRAEDIPALATNSLSLFFGDFRAAYTIVDRLGIRTLRDPYTNKPYVNFYTIKRTGGAVVDFEAIKAMKFAAS